MNIQYKSIEYKATLQGRTVTGYYSAFNNIDSVDDVIMPGAFSKTIAENGPAGKNRIWHLINHDTDCWIAKPKVLREDEKGLYFEVELPDTDLGNRLLKAYQNGDMTEHSIGYNVINSYPGTVDGREIRYITEIKLYEGSSVLWGANEQAQFTGMKSEKFNQLENELKEIRSLLLAKEPTQEPKQPDLSTERVIEIFTQKLKLN